MSAINKKNLALSAKVEDGAEKRDEEASRVN